MGRLKDKVEGLKIEKDKKSREDLKPKISRTYGIKSEDVWEMWDAGQSTTDIAKHYGVTVDAIYYHIGKLDKLPHSVKTRIGRKRKLRILRRRGLGGIGSEDPKELGRTFDIFDQLVEANELVLRVIDEAYKSRDNPRSQGILIRAAGEVRRQAEVSGELLMKLEVYRDIEAALDMIVSVIREECDEGVIERILGKLKIRGGAQPVPLEIVGRGREV